MALRAAAVLTGVTFYDFPAFATEHDLCVPGLLFPLGGAEFLRSYRPSLHAPGRLALDGSGNLFISDPARNTIVVRAPDGRVLERRSFPEQPRAIAVDDGDGRPLTVYVGESRTGRVIAYSADWLPLRELGQGAGEFVSISDMAVAPESGNVYVVDGGAHLVRMFTSRGTSLGAFGGHGSEPGQFDFPTAIAIDPAHKEVLVADQLNFRVQRFDLDGEFVCRFGDANGAPADAWSFGTRPRLLTVPQGIALDPEGRIYIADAAEGRVRVVGPDGTLLGEIGGFGTVGERLRVPLDLVIDGHGRLFVSDSNNGRLAIYGLESFIDPEAYAPAEATVMPDPFDPFGADSHFTVVIEIPGYPLDGVLPGSITANGVHAEQGSEEIGDHDGDLERDLTVTFDRAALAATLPPDGLVEILLQGQMAQLGFQAIATIKVTGSVADGDGDGVLDDTDRCPETPADSITDDTGCAIAELCPCGSQLDEAPWSSPGAFVDCTAAEARRFAAAGLIGRAEIGGIISAASAARCQGGG